ncbi:hypothetical protein GGI24_004212, partial [Coemansia furcata]
MSFSRTSNDNLTSEWAALQSTELLLMPDHHSPDPPPPPRSSSSSAISLTTLPRTSSTISLTTLPHPTALPTEHQKTHRQIISELTIEVLPALLISVAGSIVAGYILGRIQGEAAFDRVPALFIMVPILLNLKSNIELNMSTRLSTQANLGTFDRPRKGLAVMRSNMELLLLQSAAIGAAVGLISSLLALIPSRGNTPSARDFFQQSALLLATGLGCALLGSAIIGVLICATVWASHALGIDPDNIGTPIASSFGDMSTLLILSLATSLLIAHMHTPWPLALVLIVLTLT